MLEGHFLLINTGRFIIISSNKNDFLSYRYISYDSYLYLMKFLSVYFESVGGALVKFIDFRQPKTIKTAHSQQRATKIWQQSCRTICRILVAHQVANWSARRGCWIYELEMLHRKNVWLRDYMALMRAPLCPGPSNQGILQRIPWSRKSR